jgi:hypothetical protein
MNIKLCQIKDCGSFKNKLKISKIKIKDEIKVKKLKSSKLKHL